MLNYFKSEIFSEGLSSVPQKIVGIRLKSTAEVREIVRMAREIKRNMPYSMHSNLLKYDVFKLNTIDSILSSLEKEICLSVLARDVIQRTYPEAQLCNICLIAKCECFPNTNSLPFIVIDCRTEEEQQAGTLPNSDLLNNEAYSNLKYLQNLPNIYAQFKGVFHICLMGSGTFQPKDDLQKADSDSEDSEDYVQNMLENILQIFLSSGFPYVSVVEGGFQKIHEFAMHYQLQIEKHNQSLCIVCNPNGVKLNSVISQGLKKIRNKLVGRVRAFSSAVKNIVRSDSTQVQTEEIKAVEGRRAISRRVSIENFNYANTS